jgi:hypothetical protein
MARAGLGTIQPGHPAGADPRRASDGVFTFSGPLAKSYRECDPERHGEPDLLALADRDAFADTKRNARSDPNGDTDPRSQLSPISR